MGTRTRLGALSAASVLAIAGAAAAGPALKAAPPRPVTAAAPPATSAAPHSSAAPTTPAPSAAPAASAATAPGPSASAAAPAPSASAGADKDRPWAKLTKLDERLDALRTKLAERKKTLDERRAADQERVKVRWGSVAQLPAVREELRLHAMRTARLDRIAELAEVENKTAAEDRAKKLLARENARHEKRMSELAAKGGAQ